MTSELKCAPKRVPTSWTIAHDAALREVREKGHENWWELAQKHELLSHFTHHRLQTRWETELDVLLNVGPWTPEEDAKLSSPVERAVKYQRVDYMSRQLSPQVAHSQADGAVGASQADARARCRACCACCSCRSARGG